MEAPPPAGELLAPALAFYRHRFAPLFAAFAIGWIPLVGLNVQLNGSQPASIALAALAAIVLTTLGKCALLITATGFLEGAPVPFGVAPRRAATFWLRAVAVTILSILLGVVAFAVFGVAYAAVGVVVMLLGLVFKAGAPVFGAIGVAIAIVCGIALTMCVYLLADLAVTSLVTEEPNPFRAVRAALRRLLDARVRRRTILVAAAYSALELTAIAAIAALSTLILAFPHAGPLVAVLSGAAGSAFNALSMVVVLFYARDVRIQREGADLFAFDAAATPEELAVALAARDDGLVPEDRVMIDRFFSRRESLTPEARREIAARIADRARPQLRATFAHLDDEALLEHLARP